MGNFTGRTICDRAPLPESKDEYFIYEGPGPWYVWQPDAVMPPRVAKSGTAGPDIEPMTLPQVLKLVSERKGEQAALRVERPVPALVEGRAPPSLPLEEWETYTYSQWYALSRQAARGFIELGFEPFESVNVWGFNSPEWHISAYAASCAGGKLAGLYPTDSADTAAYKVVQSGGSIAVLEDKSKVERLVQSLNARGDARRLKAIVAYGFEPEEDETRWVKGCGNIPLISWKKLLEIGARGTKGSEEEVDRRMATIQPGHCAAIIYTSGTTGEPKAVMISHDSIVFLSLAVLRCIGKSTGAGLVECEERILSYLPLSHVAGMMVDIVSPATGTCFTDAWVTIHFARPYDLKMGTLRDRLKVVKPTLFLGVPLVWEKIADKMRAIGAETTGLKKTIATWAKGVGLEHAKNCQLGGDGKYPLGYSVANSVVLSNIKSALGLEHCKYAFSGAAPIRVDTLEYFGSLGLNIHEVFGMSESCGGVSFSFDEAHAWGSCGYELPGVEVRVFKVDPLDFNKKTECPRAPSLDSTEEDFQGEICYRGRNVMMGYMANPDLGEEHVEDIKKKNAEAIDSEGWLHSGDKGIITEQGMLKITGRYKELIIGEGGENIAPVPIEDHVKKCCDGIAEIMMVGDKRKFNVALVTLKAVGANGESAGTDELDAGAKRVNPEVSTISAAMDDKLWIETITAAIESANNNGKVCPNNAFKIQKFTILPQNFSEEKNELTPTKKLKRKVVEARYAAIIDRMYASKETYVRYQE